MHKKDLHTTKINQTVSTNKLSASMPNCHNCSYIGDVRKYFWGAAYPSCL